MSAAEHARTAIETLIAQGYVPGPRVEAIVLAACEAAVREERAVRQPIDTWLLAAQYRMVTLMVDRKEDPPRIVAFLDEGMLERGTGRGVVSAEAFAHGLNDVFAGEHGAT